VNANGAIRVTIPSDAAPGAHRLAVQDAENTVFGWPGLTVLPSASTGGTSGTDVSALGKRRSSP
jgi:hypothetical protein